MVYNKINGNKRLTKFTPKDVTANLSHFLILCNIIGEKVANACNIHKKTGRAARCLAHDTPRDYC